MTHPLQVQNLEYSHGGTFQLIVHSIQVGAGDILCIAGPNGSGKTTLIECLAGLLMPFRGSVLVQGKSLCGNIKAIKQHIGYVPDDENWFIKELTAREYFDVLVHVYHEAGVTAPLHKNIAQLAKKLSFTNLDVPLQQLSHGNKKKVQCIAALLHDPKIIILDEVRNGLDPMAIIAIEQIIRERAAHGASVIVSTHDLWWSERIATDVLLLQDGKVIVQDKLKTLIEEYGHLEQLFMDVMYEGPSCD